MCASYPRSWLVIGLLTPLLACTTKTQDIDSGGANASNVCIDGDLGNSIEFDLATATAEGDDYQLSSCDGVEIGTHGPDYGWTWTTPATTGYSFSTGGSTFNTVLAVLKTDCTGALLACNDDISVDNQASGVYLKLTEGEEIVLVVDGYDAYESGSIELHVIQDI
ncbi:MAG: hypothetical protein GXP62_11555 [Oligoflexia bacterium]|nr:hypothetical protein [Oligoflexia bacterium]